MLLSAVASADVVPGHGECQPESAGKVRSCIISNPPADIETVAFYENVAFRPGDLVQFDGGGCVQKKMPGERESSGRLPEVIVKEGPPRRLPETIIKPSVFEPKAGNRLPMVRLRAFPGVAVVTIELPRVIEKGKPKRVLVDGELHLRWNEQPPISYESLRGVRPAVVRKERED